MTCGVGRDGQTAGDRSTLRSCGRAGTLGPARSDPVPRLQVMFVGVDRSGSGRTGVVAPDTSPADFVEKQYASGWRRLEVRRGGEVVGVISRHPGDGERMWWGETDG